MQNFVTLSIETHLFFARIMKEHSLFLEAGFPCKDKNWIQQADWFRNQFEELLRDVLRIANGRVNCDILKSDELVTSFTLPAEQRTSFLSGIPIDTRITRAEHHLRAANSCSEHSELFRLIHRLNRRALRLLNGLISFKENILRAVRNQQLFTTNYPLLIEHILREARLYRNIIEDLNNDRCHNYQDLQATENFWNQIMMEHALFIRGLLDPCEDDLIQTADDFARNYHKLLELAKSQDSIATRELRRRSLEQTLQYREFKETGTKGILNGQIASIILPLLADHVLREANHYIRLLSCGDSDSKEPCETSI